MDDLTLKNCPFCGSGANIQYRTQGRDDPIRYVIIKCRSVVCAAETGGVGILDDRYKDKMLELVINAWNKRV